MSDRFGSKNKKVTTNKKVKSALERIDQLEGDLGEVQGMIQNLLMATNQVLSNFENRINVQAELIEALGLLAGPEKLAETVNQIKAKKVNDALANAKKALEVAVEQGKVVPVDAITEKSLIIGAEFDADGIEVAPGRMQITFQSLLPQFKEELLGKGVGAEVKTPSGGSFKVSEVYEVLDAAVTEEEPSDEELEQALEEAFEGVEEGEDETTTDAE